MTELTHILSEAHRPFHLYKNNNVFFVNGWLDAQHQHSPVDWDGRLVRLDKLRVDSKMAVHSIYENMGVSDVLCLKDGRE